VREAAGLPVDAKIHLKEFPAKKSPLEALLSEGPDSSQKASEATLARALEVIQPLARVARELGINGADSDTLRMRESGMEP
jgi:hypothetical protein